jgi:PadR family transcriptional regulator PadR
VKARALRLAAAVAFLRAMIWYDHMRAAIAALWTLVPGTARAPVHDLDDASPLSPAERAILQALISGPSYGLKIIESIKGSCQTYHLLRRMETAGLLESYEGEPLARRGRRPRRYYKLTAKGRAALGKPAMPADLDLDEGERILYVCHTHLSDDRGRLLCGMDMGRAAVQGDRVCLTRKGFDAAPERCPACEAAKSDLDVVCSLAAQPCSVCNDVVCREWPPHTREERRRATS